MIAQKYPKRDAKVKAVCPSYTFCSERDGDDGNGFQQACRKSGTLFRILALIEGHEHKILTISLYLLLIAQIRAVCPPFSWKTQSVVVCATTKNKYFKGRTASLMLRSIDVILVNQSTTCVWPCLVAKCRSVLPDCGVWNRKSITMCFESKVQYGYR